MKKNIKRGLLISSAIITIGVGGYMVMLFNNEKLWGHLPLFLFLGIWTFFLTLWERSISTHPKKRLYILMALLSGVLLSVGFPPLPFVLTLFVGFVPLLWIESELAATVHKDDIKRFAFIGFITWNILTTFWVANTSFISGVFAIFANSLLMCLPFIGFHRARKWFNEKLVYWAFIAYWLTFEYLHLHWDISWPWLTLGNGFAHFPLSVQWYEYTGVFGGSFWILVTNVIVFKQLQRYQANKAIHPRQLLMRPALFLFLPISISMIIGLTQKNYKTPATEVVIIQPNYEPHYVKFTTPQNEQIRHFLSLAEKASNRKNEVPRFP